MSDQQLKGNQPVVFPDIKKQPSFFRADLFGTYKKTEETLLLPHGQECNILLVNYSADPENIRMESGFTLDRPGQAMIHLVHSALNGVETLSCDIQKRQTGEPLALGIHVKNNRMTCRMIHPNHRSNNMIAEPAIEMDAQGEEKSIKITFSDNTMFCMTLHTDGTMMQDIIYQDGCHTAITHFRNGAMYIKSGDKRKTWKPAV